MTSCKSCLTEKPDSEFYIFKVSGKLRPRCKSCTLEEGRRWCGENKERKAAQLKRYSEENSEKIKEYHKQHYRSNRSKYFEHAAKRRANKLNATPHWLTDRQLAEIEYMYFLREDVSMLSDYKYEVDHIIPLQGKGVCGLHVPWNLQLLERGENRAKGNRI